jgi:transposase
MRHRQTKGPETDRPDLHHRATSRLYLYSFVCFGIAELLCAIDDGGMGKRVRSGYPSDVTDDEWSFVAPYLALCGEDAAQRDYPLRDVFNGLRYIAKTGSQWRFMPIDLPPWEVVYQQMRRWIDARCFETMVDDLRILLREFAGRNGQPTAMILDSRTLQSTPESGARGGYDGAKRRKG